MPELAEPCSSSSTSEAAKSTAEGVTGIAGAASPYTPSGTREKKTGNDRPASRLPQIAEWPMDVERQTSHRHVEKDALLEDLPDCGAPEQNEGNGNLMKEP